MRRFILSFALIFLAGTSVVVPAQAALASLAPRFGYWRFSDGLFIYTYLYQWPGIWTLVAVEPAL